MVTPNFLLWNEIKFDLELKFYYCHYKLMTHQKIKMYKHETKIICLGDPWVAQRFSACLWPRERSWSPGIESHIRLPAWSLLLPPPVSLPLSLSLSLSLALS